MVKKKDSDDKVTLVRTLHNMGYCSDVIGRYIDVQLEKNKVTRAEMATLSQLYYSKNKTMTLKELCTALYRSPNAVSALIRKMEKAGFVTKFTDEKDRRFQSVRLTKKGRDVHLLLQPVLENISHDVLGNLSNKQLNYLSSTLMSIRNKLLTVTEIQTDLVLKYK